MGLILPSDISNKVLIEWGNYSISSSNAQYTHTLSVSYTNAKYTVTTAHITDNNGSQRSSYVKSKTKTQIIFGNYCAGSMSIGWHAIGY